MKHAALILSLFLLAGTLHAQQQPMEQLSQQFAIARQVLVASFQARIDRIEDDKAMALAQLARIEKAQRAKLSANIRAREQRKADAKAQKRVKANQAKFKALKKAEKKRKAEDKAAALKHVPKEVK